MKRKEYYLGAGVLVAVLLASGIYFIGWGAKVAHAPSTASSTLSGASSTLNINGVSVIAEGGTVEAVPVTEVATPSLSGAIYVASDIPEDVRVQLRNNLETLIKYLKNDPKNLGYWLDLGNNRRIAKDYTGAIEAWQYVAQVAPGDYVAFNNLGDLYLSVLKDYPKAEANLKQAVALKPDAVDVYRSLYMLYLYYYKTDTSAARDTLTFGIKNNPGNQDLKDLLSEYNKTHVQ